MSSLKLSFYMLKNNIKLYFFYFLVLTLSSMFYYVFSSIMYTKEIVMIKDIIYYVKIAIICCRFVLLVSIVFFMWHSNKFFIKYRQKEIGIYMLSGISSYKIGKVMAVESMLLGFAALGIGIIGGIIMSRFFLYFFTKILRINLHINFFVSQKAVIKTCVVFIILFVMFMIINYHTVSQSQLIDLFNASRKEDEIPKNNWTMGILGITLIFGSYVLALNLWDYKIDLIAAMPILVMLICAGTYLFFENTLTIILKFLIQNKQFIYKGQRLISVSNVLHRLSTNSKNLANTAIITAAMMTALCFSISLYVQSNRDFFIEVPYSINYLSSSEVIHGELKNDIIKFGHNIAFSNTVPILIFDEMKDGVVRYSDFVRSIKALKVSNLRNIIKRGTPYNNHVTMLIPAGIGGSTISNRGLEINIGRESYTIKDELKVPFLSKADKLKKMNIFIVSDNDYEKLNKVGSIYYFHGINVTNPEKSINLVNYLKKRYPELKNAATYAESYFGKYYIYGIFYFLGFLMSTLFFLLNLSVIYFKFLNESLKDKEEYEKLYKIGMSLNAMKNIIKKEIKIYYGISLLVGAFYSFLAMRILQQMLYSDFFITTLISILISLVIMFLFYSLIAKRCYRLFLGGLVEL